MYCQAGFLNDFSNLVNTPFYGRHETRNKHEHKDMFREDSVFNKYCTSISTTYGVQIKCSTVTKVVNFTGVADSNLRCKQISFGINSNYPNVVDLSDNLIDNLNNCHGNLRGPNKVNWVDIKSTQNNNYKQYNHTDTYYDIICPNKIPIESNFYTKLQVNLDNNKTVLYNTCLNTNLSQAHNFIIMFYICIVIAVLALALFIYKRKNSI